MYDGLGSVVGEVDPLGNETCSNGYDVYGNVRSRTGTASTEHGFVGSLGHTSDSSTGLIYMRARYYDLGTGRFVSEDPKENGSNWFVYANDNPVDMFDISGESSHSDLLAALAFLSSLIAKKEFDRLCTWAERRGLTAGDLVKWLKRDGENRITGGSNETSDGGIEENIGSQMDDAGAPEEIKGQQTMAEGIEEIVEGYNEVEVASFIKYIELD